MPCARKLIFKRKVNSAVGFAELVFRVTFCVAVCLFSVVTFMTTFKKTLRNLNLCFSERAVTDFVLIDRFPLIGSFENAHFNWLICKI